MDAVKSWFSSGGSWLILGVLWLCVWLLGFTNGDASSSVWMLPVAVAFLIFGITQTMRAKRRRRG